MGVIEYAIEFIYEATCRFLYKITGSEKRDEDHCVKTGIWSFIIYLIGNDGTYM